MDNKQLSQPPCQRSQLSLRDGFDAIDHPPQGLECRLETTFDHLDELRKTWDAAVLELGGTIYMTYDWVRVWWEFYGIGKELRIFIFRAGDKIVGIVPVYIDSWGCWPIRFKVAKLVGSNTSAKGV